MSAAPPNYFATLKASCLTASQRSVAKINDYWREHGVDAGAEIGPGGEIVSRLDVRKHRAPIRTGARA